MTVAHFVRQFSIIALGAAAILAVSATKSPASAHSHSSVNIGVGVGFPVYGYGDGYGYGHYHNYYRPYYRPYYRSYYRPYYPPVVVAPPVVYAPPVIYAPPPAVIVQRPVQAVPTSDIYRANNGQYCREFQSTAIIDGVSQPTYGTACQDAGGTWRVVN
jgi:hypothetical protein